MPRVAIKKKEYKILDLKGWIVHQMRMKDKTQYDVAEALGISQPNVSRMLRIPKRGERIEIDVFTYGDLLTLCELFEVSDEEKIRLLTL